MGLEKSRVNIPEIHAPRGREKKSKKTAFQGVHGDHQEEEEGEA